MSKIFTRIILLGMIICLGGCSDSSEATKIEGVPEIPPGTEAVDESKTSGGPVPVAPRRR